MKSKVFIPVFIFLFSFSALSYTAALSGDFVLSSGTNITGFQTREVKLQPVINANAGFSIHYADYISTGLLAGFNYTYASGIDGGWSYPGFSGFETGVNAGFILPFADFISLRLEGTAGWYRYTLTDDFFFLPSVKLSPAFMIYSSPDIEMRFNLPVKYFFHKQADIFMSAGAGLMVVLK